MNKTDAREMNVIGKEGFRYRFDAESCKTCEGRCCNGETGSIFVNKDEIETISRFLKMAAATFITEYLRKNLISFL